MNQNPEQLARDKIDADLIRCGWAMQDKSKINLHAALEVAIKIMNGSREICAQAAYHDSETSQSKSCPKNAFLGLCEEGKADRIPSGKYTRSIDNKRYALRALEFLVNSRNRDLVSSELWNEVLKSESDKSKRHNCQMDVVLALWEAGLLLAEKKPQSQF